MSYADFAKVFGVLAVQLRATDVDATTIRAYFHVLKDQALEAIQRSAAALAREPGRKFFPTTAEWLTAAVESNARVFREHLLSARDEPWRLDCERCEDTGWTLHTCDGDDFCGRQKKHYAHDLAKVCACRPTNRTWQRHNVFGRGGSV